MNTQIVDISIYGPNFIPRTVTHATLLRKSRINQLEGCLRIQMRYGSTKFQKNQPSKSKKVVKPHQFYHSKKIRLRTATNIKRRSLKQCIYATQLWSVPSLFHTTILQWALLHCLKYIEQEGRFGCWLYWYIACGRMSMNISDDTRLETCRAILFLIMTTEWHILIRCFFFWGSKSQGQGSTTSDYPRDVILVFWVVTQRSMPEARRHHPHGGRRLTSRRSDALTTLMMNMTSSRVQRKVAWQQLTGVSNELQ